MIDGRGEVLYVGKAKNIKRRILAYRRPVGHTGRIDRMIAMVEGAKRQKTPNEIALTILLVALTLVFLFATAVYILGRIHGHDDKLAIMRSVDSELLICSSMVRIA